MPNYFPRWLIKFICLPAVSESSCCFIVHQHLVLPVIWILPIHQWVCNRVSWWFEFAFSWLPMSLIILSCPLAIYISSFVKYLSKPFAHFSFGFSNYSFAGVPYAFLIPSLFQIHMSVVSSTRWNCLFTLFNGVFW